MRKILCMVALFAWSSLCQAAVINMRFEFTPYLGDKKQDQVETVPGMTRIFINNIFFTGKEIKKENVPVLFDTREMGTPVLFGADSLGPSLRKGKNKIRIEFEPTDPQLAYRAQLQWTSVSDQIREEKKGNKTLVTNQTDEGTDDKPSKGKVVLEREFSADFAIDLPWHHYPPITVLSDEDKNALAALVKARIEAFKPNFSALYPLLKSKQGVDMAEVQKSKCLEKLYTAGVRIAMPTADQLDIVINGTPEVSIRGKNDYHLYHPTDLKAFKRMDKKDAWDCSRVLHLFYPPNAAAVRSPAGAWEMVY